VRPLRKTPRRVAGRAGVSAGRRPARRRARARLTYRAAGVDIGAGDEAVRRLAPWARATYRPEVLGDIGAFAGFFRAPRGYRQPVFLASTDGVGSKLRVAFLAGRHDTIGIDLVAMGVNDLLVHGAEPLVFLDYIGINRVVPRTVEAVVRGIAAGCREAGCALIGGEIAELPDFYARGEYDLAGFAVGVVEASRIVNGAAVAPGHRVLGLASSGLHSNGYSLVRKVLLERQGLRPDDPLPGVGRSVADELLEPTRIYARAVAALLREVDVAAMAHVTGGGVPGNLPRVLPAGCGAALVEGSWPVPPVFRAIQQAGAVDEAEMRRAFNMGLGYLVVLPADQVRRATGVLEAAGERVFEVGEIRAGAREVVYV
jgi:phosphoribosylformylglycinamidine cyclo-ligase